MMQFRKVLLIRLPMHCNFYGLLYINSTIENSLKDEEKALIAKLFSSIKEKA
jgi:hypothetical protein